MIPLDVALVFTATSILLALAPGPDNIFVLTQSALRGPVSGIVITLGLCTGLLVHTLAVAFGVAAIFQTSVLAFTTLKLIGAGYLLYLAWNALRASSSTLTTNANGESSLWLLYRRGIVMNITNPKVSIFFLAFLPQFTDPSRGSLIGQVFILGLVFTLSAIFVFGVIALLSGQLGKKLQRSPRMQIVLNRLAAFVFVSLALKLAVSER